MFGHGGSSALEQCWERSLAPPITRRHGRDAHVLHGFTVHNAQAAVRSRGGRKQPEGTQSETELQLEAVVGEVTPGDLVDPVQPVDHRVPVTVRELGGTITVRSAAGQGTAIRITIPRR